MTVYNVCVCTCTTKEKTLCDGGAEETLMVSVWCIIYMYIYIYIGERVCVVQQFASMETPRVLCDTRKVNDMKHNVLLLNYYRAHRVKAFFRRSVATILAYMFVY